MTETVLNTASALWLGVLTSISPCPLATNVAAVAFIGKHVQTPGTALWSGVLYTLGRAATYLAIALVVVTGLVAVPGLSHGLQKYANQLLGPIMILIAMVLLGLLRFSSPSAGTKLAERAAARFGPWGSFPIGVLFALSFCPVSGALFFGGLIPLAVRAASPVVVPALYGLGTALPVVAFAVLLAFSVGRVATLFARVTSIERWMRYITGGVFLSLGIYFTVAHTFGV